MRPTQRCLTVFASGLVAAALPTVFGADSWWLVWLLLLILFVGALAVEFAWLPSKRALTLQVQHPDVLPLGHALRFVVTGEPAGKSLHVACDVELELSGAAQEMPALRLVVAGEQAVSATLELDPARRGELQLHALHVRWTGPLKLLWHEHVEDLDRTIRIVVDVAAVRGRVSRMVENREFQLGLKVERYAGDGTEFDSIREYVQGMDHRAIDWKSSARHQSLMAREYRAERAQSMMLCVDSGRLMGEPLAGMPRLDRAIQAALELAFVSLRTGDRCGVFSFADRAHKVLLPLAGVHAMQAIQDQLVSVNYSDKETNFTLSMTQLLQQLRRRTLVVLFTDFADSVTAELMLRNLGWLAKRHLLLFVALRDPLLDELVACDPEAVDDVHRAVVADEIVTERKLVLQRIRQSGAQVLDVDVAELGPALISRYLAMKRRELL